MLLKIFTHGVKISALEKDFWAAAALFRKLLKRRKAAFYCSFFLCFRLLDILLKVVKSRDSCQAVPIGHDTSCRRKLLRNSSLPLEFRGWCGHLNRNSSSTEGCQSYGPLPLLSTFLSPLCAFCAFRACFIAQFLPSHVFVCFSMGTFYSRNVRCQQGKRESIHLNPLYQNILARPKAFTFFCIK